MTRLALADVLRQGLAPGATVDTLAIVDIHSLSAILESLVAGYEAEDPHHHWHYSDASFTLPFEADDVSPFDCFQPSAEGQKKLSADSWAAGPFAQ